MKLPTQRLLSDKTFFIEFQGYLSNHGKHAIVALDKLEAKPERIQGYWDMYTKLTPYSLEIEKVPTPWDQVAPIAGLDEWKALRGKKEKWQEMCVYLEQERAKKNDSMEELVRSYAPDLMGGIVGALTHGIIHFGWGLDAGNDWMTTEGLAYLNFCHVGVDESKFQVDAVNDASPMASMLRIAEEYETKNLRETWIEPVKAKYDKTFHPELVKAGFQWELAKVLSEPHKVATDLPTWITKATSSEQLWKDLYQTCTWIYLATKTAQGNGNFVILHSLTSLWALEKVCRVMNDPAVERRAVMQFYSSLVCLLATSNAGFPKKEALEKIQVEIPLTKHDDKDSFDWSPAVAAAYEEIEEHNIKLVYVMRSLWSRYNEWHGFSEAARTFVLTPQIGPVQTEFKA
ncbi:The proteasome is a multicatalytic proteinase complex which is characterized by its ability to cleave peptides with Arg [Seminavis robusta]|uniref:The proteasome is a multicatalytic proteinase complex which is characterized by its ability to cleave peptides with Arg n=1 Tax=Seminavis robusta TaxID=568900 RepID=A0A9N8E7A0_9STRA|nr:The proteasome is a multicatalytic proteinase complex which is characterized by its ability to cleave peptides with Arg [Seminavis robusta]|eukprot:Sro621_g176660.1 The proteasome is a multicatalytic proteinase complex which is characterized by its ability to cleave peptides with Arg (401) ;mRNA; f:5854-7056